MNEASRGNGRRNPPGFPERWWLMGLALALWVLPHSALAQSPTTFNQGVAYTISWFYAAAFDRTPVPNSDASNYGDLEGLAFWTGAYLTGAGGLAPYRGNVYAIADFFVMSNEFQTRYPASLTEEAFVAALYENMLCRAPDAGGLAFWVGQLGAGASRGQVLADFTNSEENRTSNPLRQASLTSFIALLATHDGGVTPVEAAEWLALNPTLDGARVDDLHCGGGSSPLNDTGIDGCANDTANNLPCPVIGFPDQDGDHGRDALARAGQLPKVGGGAAGFDFTKLDADGNALPANATRWDCVRDNHTGLIWEVKTTDGGLRDQNNTYTWYNPDSTTNGGNAGIQNGGSCAGSACDTHAFVQAVNQQGLCGAGDWRMPTRRELLSIVHNGRINPAIDIDYFPNTPGTGFWSSSPAYGGSRAWGVNFDQGPVTADPVSASTEDHNHRVRLVRAGP